MSLYDLSFSFLKSDFTICNSIKIDKIQKEFLNLLILSVNKDDSKTSYKFKLDKLANYLVLSKEKCCKVVKSLLQIYIEMKSISDKSYLCFNILSSVFFNIDDNYIEVAFYENIKPFYLKLRKLFELGNATELLNLNSKNSIKMYEILKPAKTNKIYNIKIERLKELLHLNNEYKLYADFKRKVLLYTQQMLKQKTDIYFEFEEIKIGKKVDSLNIIIFENIYNVKDANNDKICVDSIKLALKNIIIS